MRIVIKATNVELTAPLKEYIEQKLWSLNKFIDKLDLEGAVLARVEVGRTTAHHHKGDVYRAEVNLDLSKEVLRASSENWDIRLAVNQVKDDLQREIKKYNSLHR